MINVTELMVGNYVLCQDYAKTYDGQGLYQRIIEIDRYGDVATERIDYAKDKIHPIALTPEILEKCGFKRCKIREVNNNEIGWKIFTKNFEFILDLKYRNIGETNDYNYIVTESLKYLHQLQNLYFARTGEEIEINL